MKLLRILLALGVAAYAGWLAWPFLSPLLPGAAPDEAARLGMAGALDLAGNTPRLILMGAAVALYLLSALLLGGGNRKAVVAYVIGFAADVLLRLVLSGGGGPSDLAARSAAVPAAGGLDPQWLVLGALALVGVLIVVVSRRRRRPRAVLNLSEA